jgi:DNA-binding transcriptional ArsR family regulator
MIVAQTFKAMGDPVRLQILQRLTDGTSYTIGSVTKGLRVSRQGARKHLQVLAEAGLISLWPKGRETEVQLDATSLATAKSFITELELCWDNRLDALQKFIEQKNSN